MDGKVKVIARNRDATEAIRNKIPFRNRAGSLSARLVSTYFNDTGRMPEGDEMDAFLDGVRQGDISYVIFSYYTPIAWYVGDDLYKTHHKYSMTTSTKHMPVIY